MCLGFPNLLTSQTCWIPPSSSKLTLTHGPVLHLDVLDALLLLLDAAGRHAHPCGSAAAAAATLFEDHLFKFHTLST